MAHAVRVNGVDRLFNGAYLKNLSLVLSIMSQRPFSISHSRTRFLFFINLPQPMVCCSEWQGLHSGITFVALSSPPAPRDVICAASTGLAPQARQPFFFRVLNFISLLFTALYQVLAFPWLVLSRVRCCCATLSPPRFGWHIRIAKRGPYKRVRSLSIDVHEP